MDSQAVHRFLLTPHSDGVTFDYEALAQVCTGGGSESDRSDCVNAPGSASSAARLGTVKASFDAATHSEIASLALTGDLPPAFATGTTTPVLLHADGRSSWNVSLMGGTVPTSSSSAMQNAYAFSGTFSTYPDSGTTPGSTVTVKPGSTVTYAAGVDATASVDVVVDTPVSEFEGTFTTGNGAYDHSGTLYIPLDVALTGALRNADSAGAYQDFFSGKLTAHVDPAAWAAYDATQPAGAGNALSVTLGFAGTVTAPQRPSLSLSASASYDDANGKVTSYSGQYKTFDSSGALLRALALSGTPSSGITATETSSGITFSLTPNATVTNVTQNGATVATLDRSAHVITFPNGDFVSLEFGF